MTDMTIVLSHISALEYWQKPRSTPRVNEQVTHAKKLIAEKPVLRSTTPPCLTEVSQPFHILVSEETFRLRNKCLNSHTWKHPLYKGDVLHVDQDVFVSSPELCFMQLASFLSLPELIKVGFELCGYYDGVRQPHTSVVRLNNFIMKHKGVPGTKKALKALPHIIDNSASPMETKLTMLLTLPFKMGGYNFAKPLLNERIEKVAGDGTTLGKYYYVDLLWPDHHVVLEYDSNKHHATIEGHVRDSIREVELTILGYDVTSAINSHVTTAMGTKNLAVLLAKKLDKRLILPEPNFSQACADLRKAIL